LQDEPAPNSLQINQSSLCELRLTGRDTDYSVLSLGLRAESPVYTSPGQRPGYVNIIRLRPVRAA